MHPTVEQLLSYRDAPEDAFIATHLEQCRACVAELQALSRTRTALQGLPQLDAPNDAWMRIQAAASAPVTSGTRSTKLRARTALAFALAAGVASMAVLLVFRNANESPEVEPQSQATVPAIQQDNDLASLIAQSRDLDVLLQRLPERPRVERVSTAATLDTIEERIQWLDFQLSYAAAGELDETQARRLWRERVELMDSLVKVRYAQSGRASF